MPLAALFNQCYISSSIRGGAQVQIKHPLLCREGRQSAWQQLCLPVGSLGRAAPRGGRRVRLPPFNSVSLVGSGPLSSVGQASRRAVLSGDSGGF